ncbi:MAG: hypothetical protein K2Q45_02475 [Nitrosomonas sp.]|nr:hypothetical protein [Nitrosomonas sp.]
MEDVPLEDFKKEVSVVATQNEELLLQEYKRKMGTAIEIMTRQLLPNNNWQILEDPTKQLKVALFSLHDPMTPYFTLKAVAVVQGRASRYHHVAKDHEPYTRMPWDKDNVCHVRQMETYHADEGEIVVVESTWLSRNPRIFCNRHALGIMSHHHDPLQKTYSLYFVTAKHSHFQSPPKDASSVVAVDASCCMILRELQNEMTEMTLMVRVDPKISNVVPTLFLKNHMEELRKRVLLYEFVVKNWHTFYGPDKDPKKVENRR